MNVLKEGWFSEVGPMVPGQSFSLEVTEVLYNQRSKYQDILVFQSKNSGNVLSLDGMIQVTEADEFAYQEMITHLPLLCHPNPKKVLVVGGGDGGVLREVCKHEAVESVTLCEIDEDVIKVSKKYFPTLSCGFDNSKVTIHIGDGLEFMKKHQNEFDVIITDSSDPIGPAEVLFEKPYYELLHSALKENGIVCSQGETVWLRDDLTLIKKMKRFCSTIYPVVDYAYCCIPTYPSGQIGFILCSKNPDTVFNSPLRVLTKADVERMGLRYYNPQIHSAAFILPQFAHKAIHEDS